MWCSWARGQVNYDKGPRGLVCRPRWQSFLQLEAQAPKQNVFESASGVWHEDRASPGDALERGGKLRCVACHLRSFAQSDSMHLSHSSKPCAVGLSLPAPSFPSPLSSSFPPPSSPAPSLPLPSAFSLSSSLSLPSLLPLSLPSPSPRNPDCFSGWGWAAPALPPLQCARGDLPQLQCAGGVGVSVRRGDVAELDVRNPSGRRGEATALDVRRPSDTNPLRFFSV